jgi:hypothetical protein
MHFQLKKGHQKFVEADRHDVFLLLAVVNHRTRKTVYVTAKEQEKKNWREQPDNAFLASCISAVVTRYQEFYGIMRSRTFLFRGMIYWQWSSIKENSMPFMRKMDASHASFHNRQIFIGRTQELLYFVQNILKPEEPAHNIISIWGQGGVGKSTLLRRFILEAHTADFRDFCLTALIDERHLSPITLMEQVHAQLRLSGQFQKVMQRYTPPPLLAQADLSRFKKKRQKRLQILLGLWLREFLSLAHFCEK